MKNTTKFRRNARVESLSSGVKEAHYTLQEPLTLYISDLQGLYAKSCIICRWTSRRKRDILNEVYKYWRRIEGKIENKSRESDKTKVFSGIREDFTREMTSRKVNGKLIKIWYNMQEKRAICILNKRKTNIT